MKFQRVEIVFLVVVALLTIAIRIPAVGFGLPIVEGADDRYLLIPALEIASLEKPATQFGLPDSTLFYGYGVVFRGVFEALDILDRTSGIHPLDDYVHHHATWPLMTVRILNIGWVLGALFLLYIIARRWTSRPTAMWATTLLALSWMILEHTLYARPDVPSMVFVLFATWCAMNIADRGARKDYVIAGLAIGLSIATKYPLILTAVPVILAHLARTRRENISIFRALLQSKHLWMAAGIALLTFSIATPLFWPLLPRAIEQLQWEARSTHPGADGLSFLGNLKFYLTHVLNYGIGTLVTILSLFGALRFIRTNRWNAVILFSFPVALLFALSVHRLHWDRWMIPVLPFIALFAGHAMTEMMSRVRLHHNLVQKHIRTYLLWSGFTMIAMLTMIPPLLRTIRTTVALTRPDTQEIANEWFRTNVTSDAYVIGDPYTPNVSSDRIRMEHVPALGVKRSDAYHNDGVDYFFSNEDFRTLFLESEGAFHVFKTYYRSTLRESTLVFRADVPDGHGIPDIVAISDWLVLQHPFLLDGWMGAPIEIYAFSERAIQQHSD